jgi:5'-nucleotidase
MKRLALLTLATLLSLSLGAPLDAAGRTVTILHVTDTHSHLDATGPRDRGLEGTVGGIAKATTVIGRARAQEPDALLLHSGDVLQGDLFFNAYFGVPELKWMFAMGFDAMTLGNHELDPGPGGLAGILAAAFDEGAFPILSANANGLAGTGLEGFVSSSFVRDAGGVKVGVLGLTVPDDPLFNGAPVTLDADVIAAATREAAALRAGGAEVVVLLSHLGFARDTAVAEAADGIDVILGGHDHLVLEAPVVLRSASGRDVLVLQPGPHFAHVGRLRLKVDGGAVALAGYDLLPVDADVPPEPTVAGMVAELKAGIEATYGDGLFSREVAEARHDLPMLPRGTGPFADAAAGNLVTDAFRAAGGTDAAFTSTGFLSEGIAQGPLVPADLFRVVSYGFDAATGLGFRLVTCRVPAEALATILEIGVAGPGPEDAFFPHVSGIRFAYDSSRPPFERVDLSTVRVGGAPLDPSATYTLTVNEVVAYFLGTLGVPLEDVTPLDGVFEYTALLGHVEGMGGVVDTRSEGRIRNLAARRMSPAAEVTVSSRGR